MSNEMIAFTFTFGSMAGFVLVWLVGLVIDHFTSKITKYKRRTKQRRKQYAKRSAMAVRRVA